MNSPTLLNRALTEAEAASRMGIAARTLQRWRLKGSSPIKRLPKMSKLVRYAESEVNKYLEGRR